MTDVTHVPYRLASQYIKDRLAQSGLLELQKPEVGIICGSGLSGLSETLESPTYTILYSEIPGFPKHCGVQGHKGEVVFGLLRGVVTMCFRGRFHSYEGHDMKTVVLPVQVMRGLGVRICIVTNAAGGLNPSYNVGDVVTVSDHLAIPSLAGKNPLVGINDDELGPRFPPMSDAYEEALRKIATKSAEQLGYTFVHGDGTYCFVSGPMYESKAECRFLRSLGGDVVGMSTVPEIVTAHHCAMKVLCLSLVTNKVIMTGEEDGPAASHAEVLEAVEKRAVELQTLVKEIVANMKTDILPKLPPLPSLSLSVSKGLVESFYSQQNGGQQSTSTFFTNNSFLTGVGVGMIIVAASVAIIAKQRSR